MKISNVRYLPQIIGLFAWSIFLLIVSNLNNAWAQPFSPETMDSEAAQNYVTERAPANYVPDDEVTISPDPVVHWSKNLIVEDDAGVLQSMRAQINSWEVTSEYVQAWDLESTGLHHVATPDQKKSYVSRQLLRYLDKRLSGEVRTAEKGSTMHSVGKVHQALRPSTEASIAPNVKLKFKARALQGKAFMIVENPWVEAQSTINVEGEVDVRVAKQFQQLGVHSEIRYQVNDEVWVAQVDKKLTEKITARVSSQQNQKDMAFSSESNRTVQLIYSRPF